LGFYLERELAHGGLGPFGHLDFSSLFSFWLLKVRQAFVGMEFTWFEICVSTLGSNQRPWRFNCPSNNSLQTLVTTMACACLTGDRGNIADGVMLGALHLTRICPNGLGKHLGNVIVMAVQKFMGYLLIPQVAKVCSTDPFNAKGTKNKKGKIISISHKIWRFQVQR
jgi:hypothetical protein